MKRTVKLIIIAVAAFVTITVTNGCSKDPIWYQLFGLEEMYYITTQEKKAFEFFNALTDIMNKYDDTNIDEDKMKKEIDDVVRAYDNGVISGTFSLKKSNTSEDGPWSMVRMWTMSFNWKYRDASAIECCKYSEE